MIFELSCGCVYSDHTVFEETDVIVFCKEGYDILRPPFFRPRERLLAHLESGIEVNRY